MFYQIMVFFCIMVHRTSPCDACHCLTSSSQHAEQLEFSQVLAHPQELWPKHSNLPRKDSQLVCFLPLSGELCGMGTPQT